MKKRPPASGGGAPVEKTNTCLRVYRGTRVCARAAWRRRLEIRRHPSRRRSVHRPPAQSSKKAPGSTGATPHPRAAL